MKSGPTAFHMFFFYQNESWKHLSVNRIMTRGEDFRNLTVENGSNEILHADISGLIQGKRYTLCSPNFHRYILNDDGTINFGGMDEPRYSLRAAGSLRGRLAQRRYDGKASWRPTPEAFDALIALADATARAKMSGKRITGVFSSQADDATARNMEANAVLDGGES